MTSNQRARAERLLDNKIVGCSTHALLLACLELGLDLAEDEPDQAVEVLKSTRAGKRARLRGSAAGKVQS